MAKHRRTSSKKKVAPSLVLGASALSALSPLVLIFNYTAKPATSQETTQELFLSPPTSTTPPVTPATSVPKKKHKSIPATTTTTQTVTRSTVPPPRPTTQRTIASERVVPRATSSSRSPSSPSPRTTTTVASKTTVPTTTKTTPPPTPHQSPPSPPPQPLPQPQPQPPPIKPSFINIVSVAQKYVDTGIPYRYGGNTLLGGMDCSHFVWMVLKEAGYNVPYRSSASLASWVRRTTDPQPGDLVLFSGHVGIYVSPGMMIDQGSSGGAHLRKIFTQNFIGYGRIPL